MTFFIALFFVALIGGIVYSHYFSRKGIVRRKLNKVEEIAIADFKDDETGKVRGVVKFVKEPLIAPLTGRPCAHYRVIVEEQRNSGKSRSWHKIIEEEKSTNFLIQDGDQYALLDHKNRKSYLVPDAKYSSGFLNDATGELESFLNTHGHKSENFLGLNKTIRYREGVLEEGEQVAVAATGRWMDTAYFKLNLEADQILVLIAPEGDELYMSDDPELI